MSSSRDDTATLIVAILVILAMLGGGLLYVARKASSFRAMAAAQQARALEMEARVRAEAANAEEESQRVAQTPGLDSGTPAEPGEPGDQASLRRSLDEAAAKLDDGSVKDPSAAASLHSALGQSYMTLGDLDAAEKQFKTALDLHVKALGEADPAVAADREDLQESRQGAGAVTRRFMA